MRRFVNKLWCLFNHPIIDLVVSIVLYVLFFVFSADDIRNNLIDPKSVVFGFVLWICTTSLGFSLGRILKLVLYPGAGDRRS